MSRTIDERVVSMQFDNKNFENNAKTSIGTLERLKQSLNLTGSAKGLEEVSAAAKRCNLAPMSNAVETVRMKFSALEVMAVTALSNITNSAVNAGKRIASSLTIEPIKTGFSEYETQLNSVQTILANTQSKGNTLEDVNAALDELNKYADQTIYNFTEMTRNIGTFTAAGVDLDKSVSSIKGIANLAAVSGSSSQQASTAMYQLSQALAAGKVQLMDWNSVVNAGMGGQLFQDALKRTAKQMGTDVDAMIKKYGSFRESLTKGEWLTAKVLTETLTQLSGAYTEAELIEQGYTESQAKEITELAETAVNAATKVKTFTQLMDTLKEAAQSGWAQSWEIIVGDFEEAKELWTNVSDVLGGLITKSGEKRNKILEGAMVSNWDRLVEKITDAGIASDKFEEKVKKVAKDNGVDIDKLIEKHGSLEEVFQSGAAGSDILKMAIDDLKGSILDLSEVERGLKMGSKGDDVKAVQKALKDLKYDLGEFGEAGNGIDGIIGSKTTEAIKKFQEDKGLKITGIIDEETIAALEKASGNVDDLGKSVDDLVDGVTKLGGRELLIQAFANAWKALVKPFQMIKYAWDVTFSGMNSEKLYNIIEAINKFSEKLIMSDETADKLGRTFAGLFAILDIVRAILSGGLGLAFKAISKILEKFDLNILDVTASMGEALFKFRDWLFENNMIAKGFDALIDGVANGIVKIREWFNAFKELPVVKSNIEKFKNAFSKSFGSIGKIFSDLGAIFRDHIKALLSLDSLSFENVKPILNNFINSIKTYFSNIDNPFAGIIETIRNFIESIRTYFSNTDKPFEKIVENVKNFKEKVIDFFGEAGIKFDEIKEKIVGFVTTVKEKIGDNMGTIFAIGVLLTFLLLVKKIKDAVELIAKPFSMVEDFLGDVGSALKTFASSAKGKMIESIAKSIAILAGSVAVLALLDQGAVWSSVGAIFALAATLTAMSLILGKIQTGDLGKLAGTIFSVSGALLIFALAAKTLGGVEWSALGKCGVVLGTFMLAMIAMSKLKITGNSFAGFGAMMLQLSAGIFILGLAVKILGEMDRGVLLQGGLAVTAFLGMMVGMMAATKLLAKDIPKFASMMVGLSVALILLSVSVKILGSMDIATLMQGGLAVIAFLGLMVIMMATTRLLAKDMPKFGATMLGLGAGLLLMAITVGIMGTMDPETAVKGVIGMIGLLGLMAIMMASTRLLSKHLMNATKIGVMMLAFSASLLILVGAVALLGMMDEANIDKAIGALGKLTLMLSVLLVASKFASDCKGSVIAISIAVGVLAVSVAALSFIEPDRLIPATIAISVLMGMFAILAASTKNVTKSMGSLIALVGVIAILAGAVILLSQIPVETSLPVVASLSALILSVSVACKLLANIPVTGALMAVANLAILLGGLAAIVAIAGGIAQIPGAKWLISEGGAFLELIGLAIGQFVGGIVGGFAAGMSAGLPAIGTNLSTFMTNLQPFLDMVSALDEKTINGVEALGSMLLSLTASRLLEAVTSWLTGGSSLADFAAELVPFGEKIAEFASKVSVIGDDAIVKMESVAKATEALVKIADAVPETGGLKQALLGTPDLTSFATGLSSLGPAIVGFSDSVSVIGDDAISKMTNVAGAIDKLVEIANKMPKTSGWLQDVIGVSDMVSFATGLSSLGPAIVGFSDSVSVIGDDAISKMTSISDAVLTLTDIANALPKEDGWVQNITGIPDLVGFATDLTSLGPAIFNFSSSVSEISEESINKIKSIATAVTALIEVANALPAEDGWVQKITGVPDLSSFAGHLATFGIKIAEFTSSVSEVSEDDISKMVSIGEAAKTLVSVATSLKDYNDSVVWNTNLTEFAGQLKTFGTKMAEFGGEIKDVDTGRISTISSTARSLLRLANDMNDADMSGLASFSDEVYWFGDGIKTMYSDISDIDTAKLSSAITSVNRLITLAKGTTDVDFSGLSGFGDSLSNIGKAGIDNFIKAFSDASERVNKAGGKMFTDVLKGAKSKTSTLTKGFKDIVSDAVKAIRDKYQSFHSAGKYLVEGLAAGISANSYKAQAKAKAMAEAAVEAARLALKVNSPAKTMIPLGEAIPEGLIVGMENLTGNIKRSAVSMATTAINSTRNAMAQIAEAVNSDVSSQPTIRPILDLSDVESGAGAINGMFNMQPSVGVLSNVGAISAMMNTRQNGDNDDVISAIKELGRTLGGNHGDTYQVNGITYDDGSNVMDAVKTLIRAAKVERRI